MGKRSLRQGPGENRGSPRSWVGSLSPIIELGDGLLDQESLHHGVRKAKCLIHGRIMESLDELGT